MKRGLLWLLPLVAQAQIALVTFDGSLESPVGSTFSFGDVSSGDTKNVRFRARNTGQSPVTITTITVSGSGFARTAINGVVPSTIAPNNFLEFTITFAAGPPAAYSANLQVNSISVLLLANSIAAPVLTVLPACTAGANGGIAFPSVAAGSSGLCNFVLQNPNAQAVVVSTLAVTGSAAFHGPGLATPLTLKPNDATTFTITFTPVCGTLNYSATLAVNGRSYALTGTGLTPPLPKPIISFDGTKIASGEQHSISLNLPSPAACDASGNLNLAFTPVAGAPDDPSVMFLSGSARTLPFSVKANGTSASINGQPSAMFQTGTTAGAITFTLSGAQISGDATTTVAIPPAPISIDTAAASNQRLGELDIEITGFDNTRSAGSMSFTFFDAKGNPIGSAINADFASAFKNYFTAAQSGSAFLMRVSFPVQGDQKQVSKVQVTLSNSAGPTQTGPLTFQ